MNTSGHHRTRRRVPKAGVDIAEGVAATMAVAATAQHAAEQPLRCDTASDIEV